jgi:hypothetical protein
MRTNRPSGADVEEMFDNDLRDTLMAETREARHWERCNEDRIHSLEAQQADLIRQVKEKDAEIKMLADAADKTLKTLRSWHKDRGEWWDCQRMLDAALRTVGRL